MNADQIITHFTASFSSGMHKTRANALEACVRSAISGQRLTVTDLGRGIETRAYEKHAIKRADRLCSNPHITRHAIVIYKHLCTLFVAKNSRPIIHVDWSDLNLQKTLFLIRASLSFEGRSLTLYEEVHELNTKEKAVTHSLFLQTLSLILPDKTKPIIVTDAGFKRPWFKSVRALGWDFVGRIRGRVCVSENGKNGQLCKTLFPTATSTPKLLKGWYMGNISAYKLNLVLYKSPSKGRVAKTASGKRQQSNYSRKNARRARDPWLIATSLRTSSKLAKQAIGIYSKRMQIEEAFRDHKSCQFGLGMSMHRTNSRSRLSIIILIGTLAHTYLILLGLLSEVLDIHMKFQANTVKNRRVLSYFTLGKRVLKNKYLVITMSSWRRTINTFCQKIQLAQELRI